MKTIAVVVIAVATLLAIAAMTYRVAAHADVPAEVRKAEGQEDIRTEPPPYEAGNFGFEILVGGRPLEEYAARGQRYVEALEGAEYTVRLTNPLSVRVAVSLSVDGLNTIDAERTSAWDASKWVLMPYQSVTISGWQMSARRARRFYFTSERDSYAAKINRPGNQGVIAAVFYRERAPIAQEVAPPGRPYEREPYGRDDRAKKDEAAESGAPPPANSARRSSPTLRPEDKSSQPDDYAATGIGRSVGHDVERVNLDLQSQPIANMSLRYEYHAQLVRLGVLPRPVYPRPDPLQRRERARGFENNAYCPEPQ